MPLPAPFTASIAADFPSDFSTAEAAELATYGKDWTKVFTPNASLLVRPRTTDEVSRFL
jgi:FAD/FMN-containing dehydrogenase